jgi:tRNA(fMet)-specific endonuclease VapC
MIYLLDTDICSYIIRKRPRSLIEKFRNIPLGEIGLSVVTICEFESGIPGSSHPEKLRSAINTFLSPFSIIDFQQTDAVSFGIIDSYLRAKGTPIGDMDTMIASQALSRGLILVTNNIKHYSRIPHLKYESWK